MVPTHLEAEEVEYELKIRASLGPMEGEQNMTPPVRLAQRLGNDLEAERDPLDLIFTGTTEEKEAEVQLSTRQVQQIYDTVRRLFAEISQDYGRLAQIGSRCIHYKHRLQRITTKELEPAIIVEHQRASEQIPNALCRVTALLQTYWLERLNELDTSISIRANTTEKFDQTTPEGDTEPPKCDENQTQTRAQQQCIDGYVGKATPYIREIEESHQRLYPEIDVDRLCKVSKALTRWKTRLTEEEATTLQEATREKVAKTTAKIQQCLNWIQACLSERRRTEGSNELDLSRISTGEINQREFKEQLKSQPPISTELRSKIDRTQARAQKREKPCSDESKEHIATRRYYNYHPAISTVDALNEEAEREEEKPRERGFHHVSKDQQFVTKALGHRKFDGITADGIRTIGIQEFIGQLRYCKTAIGLTDRELLNLLPTFMVGEAWHWWNARDSEIKSLDTLEISLASRFTGEIMTRTGMLTAFLSRTQREHESLLVYMDDMRQRAKAIQPKLQEEVVIATMIDNSNLHIKRYLANRTYQSVHELNQHMEWLVCSRLIDIPNDHHQSNIAVNRLSVHATEINDSENKHGHSTEQKHELGDLIDGVCKDSVAEFTRKRKRSWIEKEIPPFKCPNCGKPTVRDISCTVCSVNRAVEMFRLVAERITAAVKLTEPTKRVDEDEARYHATHEQPTQDQPQIQKPPTAPPKSDSEKVRDTIKTEKPSDEGSKSTVELSTVIALTKDKETVGQLIDHIAREALQRMMDMLENSESIMETEPTQCAEKHDIKSVHSIAVQSQSNSDCSDEMVAETESPTPESEHVAKLLMGMFAEKTDGQEEMFKRAQQQEVETHARSLAQKVKEEEIVPLKKRKNDMTFPRDVFDIGFISTDKQEKAINWPQHRVMTPQHSSSSEWRSQLQMRRPKQWAQNKGHLGMAC